MGQNRFALGEAVPDWKGVVVAAVVVAMVGLCCVACCASCQLIWIPAANMFSRDFYSPPFLKIAESRKQFGVRPGSALDLLYGSHGFSLYIVIR